MYPEFKNNLALTLNFTFDVYSELSVKRFLSRRDIIYIKDNLELVYLLFKEGF